MPLRLLLAALLALGSALCISAEPPANSVKTTNRLANEKSPYLLQHQHNPVDWMPWGSEAFERARRENKPIFLSIGYSTCHWCHVMERESFESESIAAIMNAHFVCVKVDREERPDVDKVYMTFVQATTGSGGWPMSVWLTPDLKPFVGGTYFPPEDRGGRPGFPTVLQRIADGWKNDREGIIKHGEEVAKQLAEMAAARPAKGEVAAKTAIKAGLDQLTQRFDTEHGGFGDAPKFPQPSIVQFLLRMALRRDLGADAESSLKEAAIARKMALFTLEKMAAGGMYDHLGGGFHRYSVDTYWHIPHYEKMLYDQAQLARVYIDAALLTGDARWSTIARETLDYVLRDMTAKDGGFFSAEDADSYYAHGNPEKGEGAFYIWKQAELDEVLAPLKGVNVPLFRSFYGVEPSGNAPRGSDPLGKLTGTNTLIQRQSLTDAAKAAGMTDAELAAMLAKARRTLFEHRAKRPRPHLDDKILTSWNGLMISAFARAGQVFDEPRYVTAAQASARFIQKQLWRDGTLLRSFRIEPAAIPAFAEDYAALIGGLLDLYEADFDPGWLDWALQLQSRMDVLFADAEHGGYFQTAPGQSDILFRSKEDYDGAEPAAGSLAASNLLRLATLTGEDAMQQRAQATIRAASEQLTRLPSAMTQMLCAVDATLGKPRQIVIAGKADAEDTKALLRVARATYAPDQTILLADGAASQEWLSKRLPTVAGMVPVGGKAAAYVCEDFICKAPVTDPAALREMLRAR